jgi:signal transduction histidine kinase
MRRVWLIWLVYVASLALVVAGVAWLSRRALEAETAETEARQQAALEENTRLALWRMDVGQAAIVADESARPYFAYMTVYPAERAFGRMFNTKGSPSPMLLSPLATPTSPGVLVHFQFDPQGGLTSPQVPTGKAREQTVPRFIAAEQLAVAERNLARVENLLKREDLLAELPPVDPAPLQLPDQPINNTIATSNNYTAPRPGNRRTPNQSAAQQAVQLPQQGEFYGAQQQALSLNNDQAFQAPEEQQTAESNTNPEDPIRQQRQRGSNEFQARSAYVVGSLQNSGQRNFDNDNNRVIGDWIAEPAAAADVLSSRMEPFWIGKELVLARRVSVNGREYVQGCLLDWPGIREELLARISDLLPHADLVPHNTPVEDESRLLASLPVRLLPGALDLAAIEGFTPTHQSLLVTWASMLVGALAVAVLLQGVIALSERRASFVSAVTHELRTPLTTFRMYAEMLAEGMVTNEDDRRKYLNTLRVEADRLTHLVGNVLAYAKLERGGLGGRIAPVTVGSILHKEGDRLADRAEQAGLELLVNADETTLAAMARADSSAVEQILFNLVDNACKYGSNGKSRTLHLDADTDTRHVYLRVRDHGPGISRAERGRLFQPFRKSADDAARSAPGVGLGLALSRRLAKQMNGDLRYEEIGDAGACFVLSLPRVSGK